MSTVEIRSQLGFGSAFGSPDSRQDHCTPVALFRELERRYAYGGRFDLDVCCTPDNCLVPDGLSARPGWDAMVDDEDEAPEPPTNPITQPGDVWTLGGHRLVCGDSRARVIVAAAFNGAKANVMVTDPPYGVEYVGGRASRMKKPVHTSVVTGDDQIDWQSALQRFAGNVAYIWHAATFAATIAAGIDAIGFEIRAQLIWAKQRATPSRGHYNWAHEPCYYAVRKGSNAAWVGDAKQSTLRQHVSPGGRVGVEDARVGHPTQKPVALFAGLLANHEGDAFDPFCGSGTALIAAQQLDRCVFAIELEPKWVDVAVERWEQYTGGKAERRSLGI